MTKDFSLTLLRNHIDTIKKATPYMKEDMGGVLFYSFEGYPNVDKGDIINITIKVDNESSVQTKAEVLDISPPLVLPPDEEAFKYHKDILSKYYTDDLVNEMEKNYFNGKAQKSGWTIYMKVIDDLVNEMNYL